MEIDRPKIIAALGGPGIVQGMDSEAKAEALEGYFSDQLDTAIFARFGAPSKPMTVSELEAEIDQRPLRRGIGTLFSSGGTNPFGNRLPSEPVNVPRLTPMPARPTLLDFFRLRFAPATHVLQSADKALTGGLPEEIVLACLLHDVAQVLMKADHGWWAAQLFEPYVSEQVTFAIRYHQALRFYPDPAVGYEYPKLYNLIFGTDYTPPAYIEEAYRYCRDHKWYMAARLVTLNDLYSFDPDHVVDPAKFSDIIGRNFKQPNEGLGNDNSAVAHMWRTIANPDAPL
ncbi:MAG TPA: hypothetical protein VG273_04545 [Bryobacteraceae bacterium]|jgi:hypothetical protein|nr:hypothetical protein [Bryobacteraceae bacterium]